MSSRDNMTFQQAEQFLYSLANLPRKEYMNDASQCDVYLKRLQFFLDILDNPEKQIPHYIHVTGTSGKGSTVNFLHSILQSAGKRVASTTSPHPTTITERWKVGNAFMSKKEFVDIVEEFKPRLDEYIRTSPYDILSYFDMTTAIALYYFAKKKIDWAILEVGCGGMYDATNIIPYKDVAVITNIGLDHTTLLGKTKSAIARRKAGIITGSCTVYTAESSTRIHNIIKKQAEKKKSSFYCTQVGRSASLQVDLNGTSFTYQDVDYHTSAIGAHQVKNATLAIDIAKSLNIDNITIKNGIAKAKQTLRMEVVSKNPLIILDGAHNPDKMNTTVKTIQQCNNESSARKTIAMKQWNNIHIINGYSENKDMKKMIEMLATLKPASVACTRNTINHFRKVASPTELAQLWKKIMPKAKIETFLDPTAALEWSKKQARKSDLILVTGSIFLSGELKSTIQRT